MTGETRTYRQAEALDSNVDALSTLAVNDAVKVKTIPPKLLRDSRRSLSSLQVKSSFYRCGKSSSVSVRKNVDVCPVRAAVLIARDLRA